MTALHLVTHARGDRLTSSGTGNRALSRLLVASPEQMPRLDATARLRLALDLAEAVHSLLEGTSGRTVLSLSDGQCAWEVGLETCGRDLLVSLYRLTPRVEVVSHERRVALSGFCSVVLASLKDLQGASLGGRGAWRGLARRAGDVCERLIALRPIPGTPPARRCRVVVTAPREQRRGALAISAHTGLKLAHSNHSGGDQVERSDLLSLLSEGTLSLQAAAVKVEAEGSQVFVDTERMLSNAEQVLESWEAGRMVNCRMRLSKLLFSIHRGQPDEPLEICVHNGRGRVAQPGVPLLRIATVEWVSAIASFALDLCAEYETADERQRRNLRLVAMASTARDLLRRARQEEEGHTNPSPEPYRRSAPVRRSMAKGVWEQGGSMRFSARWVATVPGLDLRSTFLCGKWILVDSSRETACIDRRDGSIRWRTPSGPAACSVSPAGLIRFRADGLLSSQDLNTGEVSFCTRLKPRPDGGAAGSVVYAEGLPRLVAVTEGDQQISAVDLDTGALRWRHTTERPGMYRLRRVGKLFLVAGGNGNLFALDVTTGEAVWRHKSRLPFSGALAVDRKSAVAINGAPGAWRLQHLDPWSGKKIWSAELTECPLPNKHPLITEHTIVVPIGNEASCGAEAFDRESGKCLWRHHADLASTTSAWLAFDDLLVINDAAGVLLCLDALSGRPLFNHVFAGNCEADTPRRLEPVLRNGALFVPQQQVHVMRPRSGELIGAIPPDLVPDLLRVDERCDVYIGEESGHLAAFGSSPQLSVVR